MEDMKELASLSTAQLTSPPCNAESWWMIKFDRRGRAFGGPHTTRPQQNVTPAIGAASARGWTRYRAIVRNGKKKCVKTSHNHCGRGIRITYGSNLHFVEGLLKEVTPEKGTTYSLWLWCPSRPTLQDEAHQSITVDIAPSYPQN